MKLKKSKSLYVLVLLSLISVAFIDHKRNMNMELTYSLGPQGGAEVLVASETQFINQNQKLDETDLNIDGLTIPCQ